jgi:predicted Rossmann fold flavoprotein
MYEETKNSRGKIFPIINNARTVREILVDKLIELSVEVKLGLQIQQINLSENVWKILSRDTNLTARSLILTAGGKTYPSLGSDGSGYMLTQSIGHKIIEPVPCAVPLVSKNQLSHFLQGETVKMKVISVIGGKITDESTGEVMFTQYGFSGPAIFDVSRNISLRLNRGKISDVKLRLSFLPDMTADEIKAEINQRISNHPKLPLAHAFYGLLTVKSSGAVCAVSNISKDRLAGDITGPEKDRLMNVLTDFQTDILQTRGWNEAEFTSGGIDTGEIDSHTLASKLNQSLYFAGEIIDVDGMVGGYNLSWAWASGWIAGKLG